MSTIRWLGDESCHDTLAVGGKAANLSRLAALHRVPEGFAIPGHVTAEASDGVLPGHLVSVIADAYEALSRRRGEAAGVPVAVRSSAIDEDGAGASFAGQHQTFLNVTGVEALCEAIGGCIRSASTPEALAYRRQQGLSLSDLSIAVLVQVLVCCDVSAVVFSANPVTGNHDEVVINSSWGLGESIVGGTVTPDTYIVNRNDWRIVAAEPGRKTHMTVLDGRGTKEVPVPRLMQDVLTLKEPQVLEMARLALKLEQHMGWPADIESGLARDELYLLQCRPITTLAAR